MYSYNLRNIDSLHLLEENLLNIRAEVLQLVYNSDGNKNEYINNIEKLKKEILK